MRRDRVRDSTGQEVVVEATQLLPATVGVRWILSPRQRFTLYAGPRLDFIAQELAGATGLHGRKRRTGSDSERARVAVRKRVKGSLTRIRRELPAMHAHLSASLRTGTLCRYAPESPVSWTTS